MHISVSIQCVVSGKTSRDMNSKLSHLHTERVKQKKNSNLQTKLELDQKNKPNQANHVVSTFDLSVGPFNRMHIALT